MIQKTLKTTTGKLKVSIPDHLDEITLGQMMQLQEKSNIGDMEAIGILSGVPVEQLQNVLNANELFEFGDTILALSYQIKQLYNSDDIPERVTFFTDEIPKTVNVIRNLSIEPAGAFMAAREIISEELKECINTYGEDDWHQYFNPSLTACLQLLAHYFFCRVTGRPYNEYEAEGFVEEIKKLRVTEALPIAKHFFTCYPNLSKQKTNYWQLLLQRLSERLAYRRSISLNTSIL